jgi:hypothetical protein
VGTTKSHAYKLGCLLAWIDDKTWKFFCGKLSGPGAKDMDE